MVVGVVLPSGWPSQPSPISNARPNSPKNGNSAKSNCTCWPSDLKQPAGTLSPALRDLPGRTRADQRTESAGCENYRYRVEGDGQNYEVACKTGHGDFWPVYSNRRGLHQGTPTR